MQTTELQRWLQLTLAWKHPVSALQALLTRAGSVTALLHLSQVELEQAGIAAAGRLTLQAWQQGKTGSAILRSVEQCLRWSEAPHCAIVPLGSASYPPLLATCADAPLQLFVRGSIDCLHLPQLALVGSRHPTVDGRRHARRFAAELVQGGYQITSGLALGIDAESHRGALDADGVTIAVLGTGLDTIYPTCHADLAEQICQRGALVSELPPATRAHPKNFPERNRIISGLSHGVLVVEAAERSGSLITARVGAEQGREVFAIPGSIDNPLTRGCHRLLRQGVHLVESAADIYVELPALVAWQSEQAGGEVVPPAGRKRARTPRQRQLLQHLGYDPASLDTLVVRTGWSVPELLQELMSLELVGAIELQPQGYVRSDKG